MMLTPCWPSAGPTGGAGLAWPPGIWSLMSVRTFFAMASSVDLLDMVESELDGHLPLEGVHQHLELLRVGVDGDDLAVEVGERAGGDLDRLAERELDDRLLCGRAGNRTRVEDLVDLGLRERHGLGAGADEPGHARRVLDDRPRFVVQVHVHEHVAGEHALVGRHLLPVLRLHDLFGRDDDAPEPGCLVHRDDPVLEIGLDLVLVPGIRVDDIPLEHVSAHPMKTFWTSRRRSWSAPQRYAPTMAHAMITTTVPWITWARLGHSTLRSSA